MPAVMECKRGNCAGEIAPQRDQESPTKKITGYFCTRCGVTYEAVPVAKKSGQRVAPPPALGEITGRIDDFHSTEKQKMVQQIDDLQQKLSEVDELTDGAESGLGKAIQKILHPEAFREEVVAEEVAAE